MVIATMVAMVGRFIRIPYALALVITGLIIAPFHILPIELEPHILFTVLLPPLLFESAINIRARMLKDNAVPIGIFALLGTLISTFVVGYGISWLLNLPLSVGLVFGALISPTDPISVIAIFKELGVGKRLSLIMESESLFNDGLAIVLFTLLVNYAGGQEVSILDGIQSFILVVFGGVFVGGVIGFVASRLTREFNDHLFEIMLTTIVAFGAYLSAEAVHVSGVIAVVTAGLIMGSYGMRTGMSPSTRLAVNSFWEYLAFAVNSIVFLLVGFEVALVDLTLRATDILLAVPVVLVGRAAAVYLLSPLVNRFKGDVPTIWQHVLFWGGLRGAIPMALVLGLETSFPYRSELLLITFGVVLFSLLIQGLSIKPIIRSLGLANKGSLLSEYGRLASQLLAGEAAIQELRHLRDNKSISSSTYDVLYKEYREQLDENESMLEALNENEVILNLTLENKARIQALQTEKSALQEAMRRGMIDDKDLQMLSARIDDQLDELRQKTRDDE